MDKFSAFVVQRAEPSWAQDLAQLEAQCFSTPWSAEQFAAAFGQSAFVVFGIRMGTDLAAYISFYHTLDEMEILNIAVHPSLRRGGIADKLLAHTLKACQEAGVLRGVLEVRVHNEPARKLYEKHGFVQVALRKKYYADTGEDACVYVRE